MNSPDRAQNATAARAAAVGTFSGIPDQMTFLHRFRALFAALPRLRAVHPAWLILAVSAALVLFYNGQLWSTVLAAWPGRSLHDFLFLGSVGLFLVIAFNLVLHLFALPRVLKPVLILVLFVAAAVSYFASSYGAVMDRTMIANVLETDMREVGDLMNIRLPLHLLLFGLLPSLLVLYVPLAFSPWRKEAMIRGAVILGSVALVGLTGALFFQDYASLLRNHREVRFMINPSAAVYALVRHASGVSSAMAADFQRVAENVSRAPVPGGDLARKKIFVLVVGETARADHFSLNGYARNTNPELSKLDVVNFGEVRSCGTSTSESVPCMFSDLGRDGYSASAAQSRENLLDILVRAGVDVLWLENNSSCKGVCARVPSEVMWEKGDAALCNGSDCRDEILIRRLEAAMDGADGDLVVVLHQIGSHGPSYYKRFPEDYRVYAPTCDTNELQSCSREEIVNSYDDSLLYTDHILARTIRVLDDASARFDTAMLYVSDHGESLGENGIYLHGMPYMFAPDAQKHVPMVVWTSEGYRKEAGLDMGCLAAESGGEFSHDNLFHSVLGLFDVRTEVYDRALDFFAPCRPGITVAHVADSPVVPVAHP